MCKHGARPCYITRPYYSVQGVTVPVPMSLAGPSLNPTLLLLIAPLDTAAVNLDDARDTGPGPSGPGDWSAPSYML
jgi:hypothetical protein